MMTIVLMTLMAVVAFGIFSSLDAAYIKKQPAYVPQEHEEEILPTVREA